MIPKVKQKVANWNQKGTNTEPKGDQNVKQNRTGKIRPPENETNMFLGATLSILKSLWVPTGF